MRFQLYEVVSSVDQKIEPISTTKLRYISEKDSKWLAVDGKTMNVYTELNRENFLLLKAASKGKFQIDNDGRKIILT